MVLNIDRDQQRFRSIVRGKIKQNLRKYLAHGEMFGRQGKDLVSIPVPQLDLPHFQHGQRQGGVGQGEGEPGTPLGPGQENGGSGKAGGAPGAHVLEVDVPLAELAEILGEELQLPRIEPRGRAELEQQQRKYTSIQKVGPASLRHFRRTYLQALRRQVSTGEYAPHEPRVTPLKEDVRYRAGVPTPRPEANAAIFYLMDVSGSMTDDQKQIVRTAAFWLDAWLRKHYRGLVTRYLIHDAAAKEVDEHAFFHTRENGGTRISSAYKLCAEIISNELPPADWNLYCFQFSDGDNWGDDNQKALQLLQEELLPTVNLFCYGQVDSPYGSGEFLRVIEQACGAAHDNLICTEIRDQAAVYDCLKAFLGQGK